MAAKMCNSRCTSWTAVRFALDAALSQFLNAVGTRGGYFFRFDRGIAEVDQLQFSFKFHDYLLTIG